MVTENSAVVSLMYFSLLMYRTLIYEDHHWFLYLSLASPWPYLRSVHKHSSSPPWK